MLARYGFANTLKQLFYFHAKSLSLKFVIQLPALPLINPNGSHPKFEFPSERCPPPTAWLL
ncbi:hypothetical protein GCM10007907_18300 [Chitinimonas prasina]|uniref:Uncharacterized protein n=1 Tax=Chitinimonas prasina TaxID=1434937 RepID=A0ABQ5YDJ9_9NEIS|nr:hypothetical protein GCM10007907_18300 [Chitinimonas prasina]